MGIGIFCSGGDCSGMNAAIKRFVEYVREKKETPYFIYDGLEGMIDGKIKEAEFKDVCGIIHRGGTVIRSSRSKRFFEYKYRKAAFENLQKFGIDRLVVLGGDGSFRAMEIMHKEFGIAFFGIPASIDNDIYGTDYCLGVDTALNVIRHAIDNIRDTASSFSRAFVIEAMGRNCGYLALVSALTSGAEMCLIPEIPFDLASLKRRFKEEVAQGRNYFIAVVSEALKNTDQIREWFEETIGFESRATILGHIQRGGNPTVFDRLMAYEFVTQGLDGFERGYKDKVVVYKNGSFGFLDIATITANNYRIDEKLLLLGERLAR